MKEQFAKPFFAHIIALTFEWIIFITILKIFLYTITLPIRVSIKNVCYSWHQPSLSPLAQQSMQSTTMCRCSWTTSSSLLRISSSLLVSSCCLCLCSDASELSRRAPAWLTLWVCSLSEFLSDYSSAVRHSGLRHEISYYFYSSLRLLYRS